MMTSRIAQWWAVATAVSILGLACGDDLEPETGNSDDPWAELPSQPWSVETQGPFEVAYRYDEFSYTPRGDDQSRPITVSIWYPTFEDDGDHARYIGALTQPGIWEDAEPAIRDPAPVMVFSHGNGAMSTQSFFWTEFLASHGWIVVAPDHTDNTFWDMDDVSIDLRTGVYRPQDVSATLDYLYDLPSDDPLADHASDDVAISGHSFGGYTSLANAGASFDVDELRNDCEQGQLDDDYCELIGEDHDQVFEDGFEDQRIDVAIPKTPGGAQVFADGLSDIDIPTLLWTGSRDQTLPNDEEGDPIWQGLDGSQHARIDVEDGGHFTFSNMCEFVGDAVPQISDDGCGEEFIGHEVILPLINAYSLRFLRAHLEDDDEARSVFSPDYTPSDERLKFLFHEP